MRFPSLFFTVDKAHAYDLSEVLRGNGVKVYPLTEDTPKDQRSRFVRLFREGAIDGLASCGILSEGFDAPSAVGGFLCRPTKSGLLYRQMVGRILRPFPAPVGERPYQKAALHAIWNHLKLGVMNQLVVLPTGCGKTFVAAQVPRVTSYWKRDRGKRGRLLFLVHRDELVNQTAETYRTHTDLSVGIEKAENYAGDADVVVASVQTLGPANYQDRGDGEGRWDYNPRLAALNPDHFDCVIVDECFAGDTQITTCSGKIRIDDPILSSGKIRALSYNESCGVWEHKRVLRWIPKGERPTITIATDKGTITCTTNHPILTDTGWVEAGKIQLTHRIVSPSSESGRHFADADVANSAQPQSASPSEALGSLGSCGRSTRLTRATAGVTQTLFKGLRSSTPLRRSVRAVVGLNCPLRRAWFSAEDSRSTPSIRTGTKTASSPGTVAGSPRSSTLRPPIHPSRRRRRGSFTGPCSGIRPSDSPTMAAFPPEYLSRMASPRENGPIIKYRGSQASPWQPRKALTLDTGLHRTGATHPAIRGCVLSLTPSTVEPRINSSRAHGLTRFPRKGWRGGIWMMVRSAARCDSTRRGFPRKNRGQSSDGSMTAGTGPQRTDPRVDTGFSPSTPTPAEHGFRACVCMPPKECFISFAHVQSITQGPTVPVYDLEVEGNHNFVANGLLAHNCHHAVKGKYYHNILRRMRALKGEPDRDPEILMVAVTATPNRADNIGMEAICDALVYEYGIRDATKDGYLAPLRAFRCETTVDLSELKTRMGDFEPEKLAKLVNIPERNELVAREYLRVRDMISPEFESNVGRKPFACLVDFVDNTGRHPLLCATQLYGLREKFDPRGRDILEQAEEVERIESENPGLDLQDAVDIEDVRRRAEAFKTHLQKVDLMVAATHSPLRNISKFMWLPDGPDEFRLGLIGDSMLTVRQTALGAYEVNRHQRGVKTKLFAANSLAEAVKLADGEVPTAERAVLSVNASWRNEPPTEKQIRRLIMLDRKLSQEFGRSASKLYAHATERHSGGDMRWSRGGIADKITAIDIARR